MVRLSLSKFLVSLSILFCFSSTASLLGHSKVKIQELTIPESGLVLTSDTVLRANIINLNGRIETFGHKLFIDAEILKIGNKGEVIGFSRPAPAQTLTPQSITFIPPREGRRGNHGVAGIQGLKGTTGYSGIDGRQDSKSITIYAREVRGSLSINANGQQGGAGGRGGKGGTGGLGGNGREGHVNAKWDHCAERRDGGNAGQGGSPGLGGDGGRGGNGGNNIEVILRTDDISNSKVSIISVPGLGGEGGLAGEYGNPGQPGSAGRGGKDSLRFGLKIRDCSTSSGHSAEVGRVNESKSELLARTGAKGSVSSEEFIKESIASVKELTNLKSRLGKNLIRFHLERLFHKNKLELFSYLAGRVDFSYDEFDIDFLEMLAITDKEVVKEFKDFLENSLLREINDRSSKSLKYLKKDIKVLVSILKLLEESSIESAHQQILKQIDFGEERLSVLVEELAIECLDYREISKLYYSELNPKYAEIPVCEVGGVTSLRNDFFADLNINSSYAPTVFPHSLNDHIVRKNRNPAQKMINTIIINNERIRAEDFRDALGINNSIFTVTKLEISKKSSLKFSEIVTNFKVALTALEVLGE